MPLPPHLAKPAKRRKRKRKEPQALRQLFLRVLEANTSDRRRLRNRIVEAILAEKKGFWLGGKKVVTRYKYEVETLKDGRKIFITHPAYLNKGIDFQVWIEQFHGGKDRRPTHKQIIRDLKLKAREKPRLKPTLLEAVRQVWNCKSPEDVIKDLNLSYRAGRPIELTLKVLKWLFIEQDITYWNYDGRKRLLTGIEDAFARMRK